MSCLSGSTYSVVSGVIGAMGIPAEMMAGSVSVLSLCVLSVGVLPVVYVSSVGNTNESNGIGWEAAESGTYGTFFAISYGGH